MMLQSLMLVELLPFVAASPVPAGAELKEGDGGIGIKPEADGALSAIENIEYFVDWRWQA